MPFILQQLQILSNLQVFWWVFGFVLADIISGVIRGQAEQGFSWLKFFTGFRRAAYYFLAFCVFLVPGLVQTFTGFAFPLWSLSNVDFMWLVVVKEMISVLQNVKGYLKTKNTSFWFVDFLIEFLRLNAFHIVLEVIKKRPHFVAKPGALKRSKPKSFKVG